jgi:hypothetical protein
MEVVRRSRGEFAGRAIAVLAAALVAGLTLAPVAYAATSVECGLIREYTAPDPGGPTPGSIAFGLSGSVETIAADATLVPPVDTNLPFITGGAPTCLSVERDAGLVTSLEFVSSGSVTGPVTLVEDLFGPGNDGYLLSDRLFAPVELVTMNLGLSALFPPAADAGADLTIAFQVDVSTGLPFAYSAFLALTGPVVIEPDGDVRVGLATLPAGVVDAESLATFEEAAALGVDATVEVTGEGSEDPDEPGGVLMVITLAVSYAAPATPSPLASQLPDTSTGAHAAGSTGLDVGAATAVLLVTVIAGVFAGGRIPVRNGTVRGSGR